HAELAPEGARRERAGRIDEPLRMAERSRIGDAQGVVVAIIGPVSQIERLRDQFQLHTLAKFEGLGQAQIKLEERVATHRIVVVYCALLRDVVANSGASIVAREGKEVARIAFWYDDRRGCSAPGIESVGGIVRVVGTSRAELQNGRKLEAHRQVHDSADGYVMALIGS